MVHWSNFQRCPAVYFRSCVINEEKNVCMFFNDLESDVLKWSRLYRSDAIFLALCFVCFNLRDWFISGISILIFYFNFFLTDEFNTLSHIFIFKYMVFMWLQNEMLIECTQVLVTKRLFADVNIISLNFARRVTKIIYIKI